MDSATTRGMTGYLNNLTIEMEMELQILQTLAGMLPRSFPRI